MRGNGGGTARKLIRVSIRGIYRFEIIRRSNGYEERLVDALSATGMFATEGTLSKHVCYLSRT